MTNISLERLHNLHISKSVLTTPGNVASSLCAMQAQDYAGAKWSVGLRLPGATDADIENAIASGTIVRTWSLRGTLHFMAPADVRPLLSLAAPRLLSSYRNFFLKLELDDAIFARTRKIMGDTLHGKKQLTRNELMAAIEKKKIATTGLRSNHIMLNAALNGLICCAPRRGKEFTYTLLDEWVSPAPLPHRDEILASVALRYFTSHGPATINDFAGWAGVTFTDARAGVALAESKLIREVINDNTYFLSPSAVVKPKAAAVFLLPGFDEYLLGYKDRSAVLATQHVKAVVGSGNGLFSATIVINGRVAGTWKRTIKKDCVAVEINPFAPLSTAQTKALSHAANNYSRYLELPLVTA